MAVLRGGHFCVWGIGPERLTPPPAHETVPPMKRRTLQIALALITSAGLGAQLAPAQEEPAEQEVTTQVADPTATGGAPAAPTPQAAPPRSEAEVARRAQVYARFGGETLSVGDIEDAIAKQPPSVRHRYRNPEALQDFAQSLVRFRLLVAEAERREFDEHPLVSRSQAQALASHLIRVEFDQQITEDSIPQADVQAYYDAHPELFSRPAMRRAHHILLDTEEEAQALLAEAQNADLQQFRALARNHSIDTESKIRGGDLGYVDSQGRVPGATEGTPQVAEALAAAAFGLQTVGDVTLVPVEDNFSILKLSGNRAAVVQSVEVAGAGIRARLRRERRTEAIDTFIGELRQQASPEVHPERIQNIRFERPENAPENTAETESE